MAAFALTSDQREPCGHPNCILDAWHEGDHEFPPAPNSFIPRGPIFTCQACGANFVVYGDMYEHRIDRTCGEPECILAAARREAGKQPPFPLWCRCPQREHPHPIEAHARLSSEVYTKNGPRMQWPWSLFFLSNGGPT
jgi:hypothetical protein